jgi:hypothetical protein
MATAASSPPASAIAGDLALAKAAVQIRLTAIAYNMNRSLTITAAAE